MPEQGQRGGEHHRAAGALNAAGDVQHERGLGDPADQRGDRENDEADREDHAAAQAIGERPGRQQQGAQRQRVGVDHPLQVGEARMQSGLDPRQRDIHDRDVEQQHEGRDRNGYQPPLAVHGQPQIARLNMLHPPSLPRAPAVQTGGAAPRGGGYPVILKSRSRQLVQARSATCRAMFNRCAASTGCPPHRTACAPPSG